MSEMSTDEFLLPTNKDESDFEKDEFDALASLASDDLTDAVYTGWDMTSAGDDELLSGTTGNDAVYGLDEKAAKDARKADEVQKDRKMPVAVIAGIAIALLGCGGIVAYRHMAATPEPAKPAATTPAVTQPKVTPPKVQQPAVEVLDADGIQAIINGAFMYGEEDISIDPSRVIVEVRDGHVLVTHQLNEDDVPDAARLVRMAGIRANVLANMLGGKNVSPVAGEQGMGIIDVTWVVRDAIGDAFVAVSDVPGDIRTSDEDPYGVLKGAQGFAIAPEVLAALGADTGLSEAFGNAPADLDGNPIAVVAKLATDKSNDTTKTDEKAKTTSSDTASTDYYDDEDEGDGNTGGGGNNNGGNNHQSVTPTPTPTPDPTPTPTPDPTPSTPTDGGEGDGTGGGGGDEGGSSTGGETGGETGGSGGTATDS